MINHNNMLDSLILNKKSIESIYKMLCEFHEKYLKSYGVKLPKLYDSKGNFRILGRSDDIIKVAGHRMSTAEIENAISSLSKVAEVAVVGKQDKIKGTNIVAFVKTKSPVSEQEIKKIVSEKIGPISKPSEVYFVNDIPKTRSGKMMRRILKGLLEGEEIKNTSTLINPGSVKDIKALIKIDIKNKK